MYVCLCQAITDKRVRQLGQEGVNTPEALIQTLGLDDEECCGFCMHHIERMVAIANGADPITHGRFRLVHPDQT
jgi:bacterioferritin-associated ferredoxin